MLDLVPQAALANHKWLSHLGLEPLANGFDGRALLQALAGRRSAVKVVLMDQRVVVGVGNIYASEALHRAGVSPRRLAAHLGRVRAGRLAQAIGQVLRAAIDAGGSSLRDYVQSNGELGNFQNDFRVYGRSGLPCLTCGQAIQRIVQAGRATYFCVRCQR
jgi:formamidopyrimidine-DNA glycosylase